MSSLFNVFKCSYTECKNTVQIPQYGQTKISIKYLSITLICFIILQQKIVSNTLQKRLLSLTNNFELVFIEVKSVLNYRLMSIRIHYRQRKADANKTC